MSLLLPIPTPPPGPASPDVDDPFAAVRSSTDLWAMILQHVPLLQRGSCASTCRAHLSLKEESTRHITHLGLSIEHRWMQGEPISSSTPYVCLLPAESANDFVRLLSPQSFDNCVRIYDGRGLVWPILPRVTAIMPHLTHLCIDLTLGHGFVPFSELSDVDSIGFNPKDSNEGPISQYSKDWIRRLNLEADRLLEGLGSTASYLHVSRSPAAETGPEPWGNLPMRTLTHLAITAEAGWECKRRQQKETNDKIVGIFLSCAIVSQRTLRHLDLTGLGPALIPALEGLELPHLELLRVGHEVPGERRAGELQHLPPNALSSLAKSFPTLTALDVGYASVQRGVSFEEVDLLCRRCDRLRHLDLSMVMTYVDFTPCLLTLSKHAPQLISLAIHGLEMQSYALLAFGIGCPLLARVYFRHCGIAPNGLLAFLRVARNLREIDLSNDVAGYDESYDGAHEPFIVPSDLISNWLDEAASDTTKGAQLRCVYGTNIGNNEVVSTHPGTGTQVKLIPAEWQDARLSDVRLEGAIMQARRYDPKTAMDWCLKALYVRSGVSRLFHTIGEDHMHPGSRAGGVNGPLCERAVGEQLQPWNGKRMVAPWHLLYHVAEGIKEHAQQGA